MIAKLIAWGARPRRGARPPAARARRDHGRRRRRDHQPGRSCSSCSTAPELREGEFDTGWLDRLQLRGETRPGRHADVALLAGRDRARTTPRRRRAGALLRAARAAAGRRRTAASAHDRAPPRRQRYRARRRAGRPDDLPASHVGRHRGRGPGRAARRASSAGSTVGGRVHRGSSRVRARTSSSRSTAFPHRFVARRRGLRAQPAPAVVVSIPVAPGDEVAAGDVDRGAREHEDGDLGRRAVHAAASAECSSAPTSRSTPRRRSCSSSRSTDRTRPRRRRAPRLRRLASAAPRRGPGRCRDEPPAARAARARLRHRPDEVARLVDDLQRRVRGSAACDPGCIAGEHRAARHLRRLSARSPGRARRRGPAEALLRSPQEYLHAYLRSLDAEAEGCPTLSSSARAGARPLRRVEPRAHAGARGSLLPPVPLAAAR